MTKCEYLFSNREYLFSNSRITVPPIDVQHRHHHLGQSSVSSLLWYCYSHCSANNIIKYVSSRDFQSNYGNCTGAWVNKVPSAQCVRCAFVSVGIYSMCIAVYSWQSKWHKCQKSKSVKGWPSARRTYPFDRNPHRAHQRTRLIWSRTRIHPSSKVCICKVCHPSAYNSLLRFTQKIDVRIDQRSQAFY